MIEVKVKGTKEMRSQIRRLATKLPNAAAKALYLEAEKVRTRSMQKYVPKNLGALHGSIAVSLPVIKQREISVEIYAGGPAAPYALAIHEHPSEHSPRSWQGKEAGEIKSVRGKRPWVTAPSGGRGPKFLERPLREAANGMGDRIGEAISAGLTK